MASSRPICEEEEEDDSNDAEEFKCIVCRQKFVDIENIGTWRCWQHPGIIENGKWTCCNSPSLGKYNRQDFYAKILVPATLGCTRSDHRVDIGIYTKSETNLVRTTIYELLNSIGLLNKRAVLGFKEKGVLIARADYKYQDILFDIMKHHFMAMENPSYFSDFYVSGDLRNMENVKKMLQKIPSRKFL